MPIETEMASGNLDDRPDHDGPVPPATPGLGMRFNALWMKVQALALRVLAERLEHGEAVPELLTVTLQAA